MRSYWTINRWCRKALKMILIPESVYHSDSLAAFNTGTKGSVPLFLSYNVIVVGSSEFSVFPCNSPPSKPLKIF